MDHIVVEINKHAKLSNYLHISLRFVEASFATIFLLNFLKTCVREQRKITPGRPKDSQYIFMLGVHKMQVCLKM